MWIDFCAWSGLGQAGAEGGEGFGASGRIDFCAWRGLGQACTKGGEGVARRAEAAAWERRRGGGGEGAGSTRGKGARGVEVGGASRETISDAMAMTSVATTNILLWLA